MTAHPFDNEKLNFPLNVHYRIVVNNTETVLERLEAAVRGLGIKEKIRPGNSSSTGRFLTYTLDITVNSKEQMDRIDQTIRVIEDVRYVL